MIKTLSTIALAGLVAATISGCGAAAPQAPAKAAFNENECFKSGEQVPMWVCNSSIEGASYAAVGVGTSKNESMKQSQAISRARANLAMQVKVQVKAKVEDFVRATGNGDSEVVDAVSMAVTKQTAKVNLQGSKKVKEYTTRGSNTLYVLVAVPDSVVNEKVKEVVKSSHKNENALWQQFQSKQALENLDKEFPTN